MNIKVTFQPSNGGTPLELKNVKEISWGASRHPRENGELGNTNHELEIIHILREKALMQDGKNKNETEVIALAAALEDQAYFKGTVTITPASGGGAVQKLEWTRGHICSIQDVVRNGSFLEHLQVAVTGLKVDNSEFLVGHTT
jgi:hypothetical protein